MAELDRRLRSVARRVRAMRALDDAARWALVLAPLGTGVAVARWAFPGGGLAALSPRAALALAFAPAGVAAAAGALRGALPAVPRARAAALVEERAALGAGLSTALELEGSAHPWRSLVLAQAEEVARALQPSSVAPLRAPERTRSLLLVALATLVLTLFPIDRLRPAAAEPATPVEGAALDAMASAGAKLREASEALSPGDGRRTLDEAGKDLRAFGSAPQAASRREALAKLGEARARLDAEDARARARSEVREALAADRDLARWSRLGGGGGTPPRDKIDALARKLASDPGARDAASEALSRAARSADAVPELREPLERAARALEAARSTPPHADAAAPVAPALEELARALDRQPAQAEEKKARRALDAAKEALGGASAAVRGEKPAPSRSELAASVPPELVAKALEAKEAGPGGGGREGAEPPPRDHGSPISPDAARKVLDELPRETLEALAKAAREAAPGKLGEAAQSLPDEVKDEVAEATKAENAEAAKKDDDGQGIPPEALAKMADLVPPELIAKALSMRSQGESADTKTPPISPEDAREVLERLSPKTLEKLAKAVMESGMRGPPPAEGAGQPAGEPAGSAESPAPRGSPGAPPGSSGAPRASPGAGDAPAFSPEAAQAIARGLSPETLGEIQKAAQAGPASSAGRARMPGGGTANTNRKGVLGRQSDEPSPDEDAAERNPAAAPRVGSKDGPPAPPDPDEKVVKSAPRVEWSSAPDQLPSRERSALRAELSRERVPASYEKTVREYFDLGKP